MAACDPQYLFDTFYAMLRAKQTEGPHGVSERAAAKLARGRIAKMLSDDSNTDQYGNSVGLGCAADVGQTDTDYEPRRKPTQHRAPGSRKKPAPASKAPAPPAKARAFTLYCHARNPTVSFHRPDDDTVVISVGGKAVATLRVHDSEVVWARRNGSPPNRAQTRAH